MVKVDVRPMLTLGGAGGAQDVSAACNLRFNHNDNEVNVSVAHVIGSALPHPNQ